jgi:transposase
MIQVTPQTSVFVAIQPADFRKGIDGLSRLCQEILDHDPFSGAVFVFRNRRATAVKLLFYDGQGFWLCQKRLSKGYFRFWPKSATQALSTLEAHELHVLLRNGDPSQTKAAPQWRSIRSG